MHCAAHSLMDSHRLALGTVQFGTAYGIANLSGQVEKTETAAILEQARTAGLDTLDTASGYGDSEQRLGEIGVAAWQIVTKLPPLPENNRETAGSWAARWLEESLRRLRVDRVYGLLLHRPMQLLGSQGDELYRALAALRSCEQVEKIGVSVYSPGQLDALCGRFAFDLVQAPFNIVDRRLEQSGWLQRLHAAGVEVHTRSLFLQGLLLMEAERRPAQFARWQGLWARWNAWLAQRRLTALQAALSFGFSRPGISRLVVGVDSRRQLQQILSSGPVYTGEFPDELQCDDPALIDPSQWKTTS